MTTEHYVMLSLLMWIVALGISYHLANKTAREWEKNSNEWRKMATGAIAEVLYWRRLYAATSGVILQSVPSTLPDGITATQISDKLH